MELCEYCNKELKNKSSRAKFCNDICRASFHQKKRIESGDELILVKHDRIKFVQILNPTIKTAKQLFDFFYEEYCKLYKVEKPSVFQTEPQKVYDAPRVQNKFKDEPKQWEESETDNLQVWKTEMNNCESIEELDYVGQRVASSGLSRLDQNILNKYGKHICERKSLI